MSRIPFRIAAKSKYYAKREGKYASKKEARRAAELALLLKLGEIRDLDEQVVYVLIPKDDLGAAVTYRADFCYKDAFGFQIVEDVKGFKTPVYKLKRRLMFQVHGIKIVEI